MLAVLAALAVAAFLVWFVFFSSVAPGAPTIEGAAAVLGASPQTNGSQAPGSAASTTGNSGEAAAGTDSDGSWTVDTDIGEIGAETSSYVGFRVAEVLEQIGEAEAIGRTPAVSGALVLAGTTLERARIEADLTQITSDQARRDPAIQRALETTEFPTASFESSGPVELGAIPILSESVSVSIPGVLTIHGVSRDVVADMEARRVGDVVAVVGTLPVDFTSFGVTMPRAPVVVSVEDEGRLEWQLFFRKDGPP
jgi:polyisoprenoid-binding protein YceI